MNKRNALNNIIIYFPQHDLLQFSGVSTHSGARRQYLIWAGLSQSSVVTGVPNITSVPGYEVNQFVLVVGKYRFWRISPYTWVKLFNYIQINHIRGWDSVIIRHHPCSNHMYGWTQSQIH